MDVLCEETQCRCEICPVVDGSLKGNGGNADTHSKSQIYKTKYRTAVIDIVLRTNACDNNDKILYCGRKSSWVG